MRKTLYFWKPFGRERLNESLKLLHYKQKYFSATWSLFLANLSWKKLVLVISEILGLVVNTFISNCEYYRSNRDDLPLPVQMLLYRKQKRFFGFIGFFDSALNFWYFEKKLTSQLKHLWRYWLPKTCLIKCIKGLVSQNPLAVNLLTSL